MSSLAATLIHDDQHQELLDNAGILDEQQGNGHDEDQVVVHPREDEEHHTVIKWPAALQVLSSGSPSGWHSTAAYVAALIVPTRQSLLCICAMFSLSHPRTVRCPPCRS